MAGPAALLVAKMYKLGDRLVTPDRLNDKDAHDAYRLLVATPTATMAASVGVLLNESLSADTTVRALGYLGALFADGPGAPGSSMAGRAEEGVGDPATVSASAAFLAQDLLAAL